MAAGGGTKLRKGSPSSDSAPSFATVRQGAAPMFGYSALSAFPLRHQRTVRLAVESLACVVRRWMLSHEVGVNSAAKPKGQILVCVKKLAVLGIEARVAKPPRAAGATKPPGGATRRAGPKWEGTHGGGAKFAASQPLFAMSVCLYPIKFFEEGVGETFFQESFPHKSIPLTLKTQILFLHRLIEQIYHLELESGLIHMKFHEFLADF